MLIVSPTILIICFWFSSTDPIASFFPSMMIFPLSVFLGAGPVQFGLLDCLSPPPPKKKENEFDPLFSTAIYYLWEMIVNLFEAAYSQGSRPMQHVLIVLYGYSMQQSK